MPMTATTGLGWSGSVRTAWDAMTSTGPARTGGHAEVASHGLAQASALLTRALYAGPGGERRLTPSAGAIFPFTALVLAEVRDETATPCWQLFRMSEDGRALDRLPLPRPRAAALAARLAGPGGHVLLLVRPWLSMRKYGARGYLYAHLDTGHAAAGLAGGAPRSGVLRLRLPRAELRDLLSPAVPEVFELHSVLSFGPDTSEPAPLVPVTVADPPWDPVDPVETLCWHHLAGTLQPADDDGEPSRPVDAPIIRIPAGPAPGPDRIRRDWHELAAARRSSRQFAATRLDPAALARTVRALGTALPTDLGPASAPGPVRATIILGPGYIVDDDIRRALGRYGTLTDWPADVPVGELVAACRGQRQAGQAQAFVLLHLPERALLVEGRPQLLREALFRAAGAAHLVQLGAAGAGAAVATIGRFDAGLWHRAGLLPAGEHIVYLMALGVMGEAA